MVSICIVTLILLLVKYLGEKKKKEKQEAFHYNTML